MLQPAASSGMLNKLSACRAGKGIEAVLGCLQLSFEEGQTSQGHFTLKLQLKNDREACLYRPGIGQVCVAGPRDSADQRSVIGIYLHNPMHASEHSLLWPLICNRQNAHAALWNALGILGRDVYNVFRAPWMYHEGTPIARTMSAFDGLRTRTPEGWPMGHGDARV